MTIPDVTCLSLLSSSRLVAGLVTAPNVGSGYQKTRGGTGKPRGQYVIISPLKVLTHP